MSDFLSWDYVAFDILDTGEGCQSSFKHLSAGKQFAREGKLDSHVMCCAAM